MHILLRTLTLDPLPRYLQTLSDSLPPILQYALGQVAKLRTGTTQEQLQTILNLGESHGGNRSCLNRHCPCSPTPLA